jgi:hypothetical protein
MLINHIGDHGLFGRCEELHRRGLQEHHGEDRPRLVADSQQGGDHGDTNDADDLEESNSINSVSNKTTDVAQGCCWKRGRDGHSSRGDRRSRQVVHMYRLSHPETPAGQRRQQAGRPQDGELPMTKHRVHSETFSVTLLKMTEDLCSRPPFRLTSARAATFVTSPVSSRFFTPFLGRERTVASVAHDIGVSIGAVTYRMRQMIDLGLIVCTRIQTRAGRPIRHYRSAADAVFAPLELTSLDSVRHLFSSGRTDTQDALDTSIETAWLQIGRDHDWGTHLYRPKPDAPVNRDFVPASLATSEAFWEATLRPNAPAVWDQYAEIRLTHRHAKRFQRELAELVRKYGSSPSDPRSRPYLVHLALAPQKG